MSIKEVLQNRNSANNSGETMQKINPLLARRLKMSQEKKEPTEQIINTERKTDEQKKITQDSVNEVVNNIVQSNTIEKEYDELDEIVDAHFPKKTDDDSKNEVKNSEVQTESTVTSSEKVQETLNLDETSNETENKIINDNSEVNTAEVNNKLEENSTEKNIEETSTVKTRATRKSRKSKSEETQLNNSKQESQQTEILDDNFNYEKNATTIIDNLVDDEWKAYEKQITDKLDAIRIEPDMNPGTLKYALAELNNLYDEILIPFIEQKKLLDSLIDKEFGIAHAYKVINKACGNNENEREANAMLALMSIGEEKINFISLIAAVRMRYTFLNSILQNIQYKSNLCITMSGALKMELNLLNGAQ